MSDPLLDPWRLSATDALVHIRSGALTATAYAKSLLSRIQTRDPDVKAWVYLNPSLILARAKELDALTVEERGPLHGLPVAIKDVMLTKDMPTQYNSKMFEVDREVEGGGGVDANAVMVLRAAGAVVFGKTSTTEFATSKQGNWHQNLTSNAHDSKRTPGGSSSGSGAAVGDFQVPLALGTQTGGSIIRPASFNGCYGFKPTWGTVSREGLAQWSTTLDTNGFFARSIADLEALADAFRLADDTLPPQEVFNLKGANIALCKTHNWHLAGPGTQAAMQKARSILEHQGAKVSEIGLPEEFGKLNEWHAAILAGEGRSSFLGQYATNKGLLHEQIVGHVENSGNVSRQALLEAYDKCARLRPAWDDISRRFDLVLTPSVVDEAPLGLEATGNMSFCSPWTALHVPALNVPGFAGEHGMPIGLTAVGPRYTDRRLLHVCAAVGDVFEKEGGWSRKND